MMRHLLLLFVFVPVVRAQSVTSLKLGVPTELPGIEFSRVADVRELSDGRLLVGDAIEKQAYIVDFAKGTARKLGRVGAGPGEYRSPGRLLPIAGDSTLLVDNGGGRWLIMVRDSFVGIVRNGEPATAGGANPLGADQLGHLLGTKPGRRLDQTVSGINAGRASGNFNIANDTSYFVRVDRATGRLDTLARYRVRPTRIDVKKTGEVISSISVVMNPVSTGEQAVLFADGAVAIARLDPYRVDWIIGNATVQGRSLPVETVPLDREEKLAILARLPRADSDTPRQPEDVADWPETLPPFPVNAALPAADGMLWIRRAPSRRAPGSDYDVVDRSGRLVRRLHLPKNEIVAAVGRTFVFVIATDDDDLQHLKRYPLPR